MNLTTFSVSINLASRVQSIKKENMFNSTYYNESAAHMEHCETLMKTKLMREWNVGGGKWFRWGELGEATWERRVQVRANKANGADEEQKGGMRMMHHRGTAQKKKPRQQCTDNKVLPSRCWLIKNGLKRLHALQQLCTCQQPAVIHPATCHISFSLTGSVCRVWISLDHFRLLRTKISQCFLESVSDCVC